MLRNKRYLTLVLLCFSLCGLQAQQIISPTEHFGFNMGADYQLANYSQMEGYFHQVAEQSDRVLIQEAGLTEEGRQQYLLIISSPENLQQVEKY
ncbi:MAG: peptidase, partial [Sphingobacterium sp.]